MFGKRAKETFRDKHEKRAYARLLTLPEHEVLNWTEQAVNGIHMSLDALRRPDRLMDHPAALTEVRRAVSLLSGAVKAMEDRLP